MFNIRLSGLPGQRQPLVFLLACPSFTPVFRAVIYARYIVAAPPRQSAVPEMREALREPEERRRR